MKKYPFLELSKQVEQCGAAVEKAVVDVLRSGWYLLGEQTRAFEEAFAAYLGEGEGDGGVTGCNSGTDALILSLLAAGVQPGDEVVAPALTAVPTVAAIISTGATPVLCDVDPATRLMEPDQVEACISSRTRAVIAVHLYGNLVDIPGLRQVIGDRPVTLIEDVAQACGASLHGRAAGTMGDYGAFSFYPTKNLGAMGDGGAVYCPDPEGVDRLRMLRFYGQEARDRTRLPRGMNSRLDEVQAAVLLEKLPLLDEWNRQKAARVQQYEDALAGCADRIRFARIRPGAVPGWHLMVLQLVDTDRQAFQKEMADRGVSTLVHYPTPMHRQPAFGFGAVSLPVAERLCDEVISLPLYPGLAGDDVQAIAGIVQDVLQRTGIDRKGA